MNIALAADTCSIQNQASPEFLEYQNKLQAELTKIRSEMSAKNCGATPFSNTSIEREQEKSTDLMYSIINETRDLNTLQSSFQFNISRLITSDDLPLLRRERNTLTNQAKSIEQTMDEMFGRCAGNLPYNNGSTLQSSLSQLYADHIRFTAHFESIASGYETLATVRTKLPFNLTPKIVSNSANWLDKISESYGPKGLKPCYEEGKTMIETWKRIIKIWTEGANISKGMQTWKDAYKLLMGTDSNYNAKQKKLLSSYLAENGITGDYRDNLMKTLACRQNGGSNCGFPVSFGGKDGIIRMKNEVITFYEDATATMVNFRKKSKEAQAQYMNSLQSYQGDDGIAGAFKNLKNVFAPVPDIDTQSIVDDSTYEQDLKYIQQTTQNLYDTLKAKSNSDLTDQVSIDSLKVINKQVYDINIKLKEMQKDSRKMCTSQDIANNGICMMMSGF